MTMARPETTVRFVGTASYNPPPGEETSCCLVNDDLLFDCGWDAAGTMRGLGLRPGNLRYLLITHCHFDHVYGLPQLLMWRRCEPGSGSAEPLTIIGPADDIERAVEAALAFVRCDPSLNDDWRVQTVPLQAGETWQHGPYVLETCAARHYPTALCYRLTDQETGKAITFTGDTARSEEIIRLAQGSDLLIHEVAEGPAEYVDPLSQPGHAGALDAAEVAKAADVKRLILAHCNQPQLDQSVLVARQAFAETYAARQGASAVV